MPEQFAAADAFLDAFGLVPERVARPDSTVTTRRVERALLVELGHAFSKLPYENLTKLLKKQARPPGPERRRQPAEVLDDHLTLGAGGTCFSLARLFLQVLARLGYRSRPVLCHLGRGRDNHCALLVDDGDGGSLLLDPGYLLHDPLPLARDASEVVRGEARLTRVGEARYALSTYGRRRYQLELAELPPARFEAVWDASFDWTMMNGIHVCAADDAGGYGYVHGHKLRLQGRGADDKQNVNLRGREAGELAARFGLDQGLVTRAYAVVAGARTGEGSDGRG